MSVSSKHVSIKAAFKTPRMEKKVHKYGRHKNNAYLQILPQKMAQRLLYQLWSKQPNAVGHGGGLARWVKSPKSPKVSQTLPLDPRWGHGGGLALGSEVNFPKLYKVVQSWTNPIGLLCWTEKRDAQTIQLLENLLDIAVNRECVMQMSAQLDKITARSERNERFTRAFTLLGCCVRANCNAPLFAVTKP